MFTSFYLSTSIGSINSSAVQELHLCSSPEKTAGPVGLLLSIFTNQIVACSNHAAEIIGENQRDEETKNNICLMSDEHFVKMHKLNFEFMSQR